MEETEEEVKEDVFVVKPSFEELTSQMNTRGYWSESANDTLRMYFVGQNIDDANLRKAMDAQQWAAQLPCNQQCIFLTILALFVLKEVFVDREDEWQLLAQKAKNLLRECGIKRPDGFIK